MKTLAKKIVYRLRSLAGPQLAGHPRRPPSHSLFEYTLPDGSFDYDGYRRIQEAGNKLKIDHVFADEQTIAFISSYLRTAVPDVRRGLCHGTRRGLEQQWFSEQLGGIEVLGTDISETATQFPNSLQWDFHDEHPDWVGAFDFVYTNSHDHAYDPEKAFNSWAAQTRTGGVVLIEHTSKHRVEPRELDPFGVSVEVLPYLIAKWGKGRFAVTEILEPGHTKPNGARPTILVVRSTALPRRTPPTSS